MSNAGYNMDKGSKDYLEARLVESFKVELKVSNARTDEVNYWVNEITNQCRFCYNKC